MTQIDTSRKDSLLAAAIAAGSTVSDAARQIDVSLSTAQRRMAEPAFRRQVADLRAEMVSDALGYMSDNLTRAARSVAGLLEAPEPHIRLRAARILLSLTLKVRDAVDVDTRIRDLEEELARRQGYQP